MTALRRLLSHAGRVVVMAVIGCIVVGTAARDTITAARAAW